MASMERRITLATSGGATPATDATEPAPRTTPVEASHSTAGQDESMASKLADLRKRMDEERAYINTMEEALELFQRMHGDDYNAYPEAVRDFAKKQARIQEENRRKRRHQDIEDEWEGPQQEEEAETASTVSMEVTPAQRPTTYANPRRRSGVDLRDCGWLYFCEKRVSPCSVIPCGMDFHAAGLSMPLINYTTLYIDFTQ
ncbi:hypothetical protein VC83_08928 [Pseudogymnoascus destructans]|uniref:Uncharacterized protein n=2 Tax=Pseudogymnoascus destructans TaxID=655981 RepID=L8G805_PSED2|nr:uncharacterized protein VC83_08928 [Pseudogymnoascus destructans]ELR08121.1 hypothetical protein GMDG_02943 [Pseudogymnoascus destructans 20631-21]OAF54781.1 hypothetical protein VC83_08928 [Pseudogymnoascus destructans]